MTSERAAIHLLFQFASYRHPEHADLIARVLAFPPRTTRRTQVVYLDDMREARLEAVEAPVVVDPAAR